MHEIYNYSLEQLDNLESSSITLKEFNADVAWELGMLARKKALTEFPKKAIVINISLISGQVLFHTVTNSGTAIDNDEWVARKKRTVFRFGKSSFYLGQKLRIKNKPLEEANFISSIDYATHGGSVPIRIDSFDGVIGALTISGLAQEEDHLLAIGILEELKSQQLSHA